MLIMAVFATPQDRRNLLRQHEAGKSVIDLADKYECDRRTVLTALELAEEERSLQQARDAVYQHRLERHFDALCRAAEDIRSSVRLPFGIPGKAGSKGPRYRTGGDVELLNCLRSHLPGSPIWKLLRDWESGNERYASALRGVAEKSEAVVAELNWQPESSLALTLLVQLMAQGSPPPDSLDPYPPLAKIGRHELNKLLSEARRWPESEGLAEVWSDLRGIYEQLSEQLDTIIYTVIMPGRCDYCSPLSDRRRR